MANKKWIPRRIIRDVILSLILISVAVILPVAYLASQARHDISEQFIHNTSYQAVAQFQTMVGSVEGSLDLVRDWGQSGSFSLDDPAGLNRLLSPLFTRENLLQGISIADLESNSFYLHTEGEGFRTRQIQAKKKGRESTITFWDKSFDVSSSYTTNSTYDPRNRPWFAPALAQETIVWTEPYSFFTSGKIGMTASTSYLHKKTGQPVVVAFDILLEDLFTKLHKLAPSENGRVFIFRRDTQLYIPDANGLQSDFISLTDVNDSLIQKAHTSWFGDNQHQNNVISFIHEGSRWWCGFKPLGPDRKTAWICIMVPESDILGHAGKRSKRVWLFGLIPMLIASASSVWIIHRYNRSEGNLALFKPDNPEQSIRQIIAKGENRTIEFKSTMRMNLHTKKPGKEIELAWTKGVAGFLNTDGGILLLGVTDDGEITGIEQDVFENEDKCRLHFKNLIAKHIGAEFSKQIRFILVPMARKTVGVVLCTRSSEPIFLKEGSNKEHFYIRNGPSSDELPVSQALRYIKHRK